MCRSLCTRAFSWLKRQAEVWLITEYILIWKKKYSCYIKPKGWADPLQPIAAFIYCWGSLLLESHTQTTQAPRTITVKYSPVQERALSCDRLSPGGTSTTLQVLEKTSPEKQSCTRDVSFCSARHQPCPWHPQGRVGHVGVLGQQSSRVGSQATDAAETSLASPVAASLQVFN